MLSSKLMKQQAEEADRIIAELAALEKTPPEELLLPDSLEEVDIEAPVEIELPELPPVNEPEVVVTPAPAPDGGELAALRSELDKSEHRYSTLQGMLEARNQDMDNLRAIVASLSAAQAEKDQPEPVITDKDKETFGADVIDLITRVSQHQMKSMLSGVEGRVEKVAQVATATATGRFDSELRSRVPDWETVNVMPEFIAWLGKYNVKALNEAYSAFDLHGTAKFFEDYKKLYGPAPVAPSAATIVPDKLAHLAAPAKGKVVPINQDGPKGKIWTSKDMNKLYDDLERRRITKTEFDKLEADLFKAQREGRIAA